METFTWDSQVGAGKSSSFRKGRNEFGDGYTQHYSIGINNKKKLWNVGILEDTEIEAIEAFLDRHKGVSPFLWTPPLSTVPVLVICESYETSYLGNIAAQISAVFEAF